MQIEVELEVIFATGLELIEIVKLELDEGQTPLLIVHVKVNMPGLFGGVYTALGDV